MRIFNLSLATVLFALLSSFSAGTHAAEGAIKATSIAQIEAKVIDKKGKKLIKRKSVDKAMPGTEVIYTTRFRNIIKKPVGNIVINNPIPNETEYKVGSAFGKNCEIQFSADGGKTFGHADELKILEAEGKERAALPSEYTNIRWTYQVPLAAGKYSEVGFRATIK